jgi:hypothetical protein
MAANLRGDLLGAATDVAVVERGVLSPLVLWSGIVAGPIAWAIDLLASYAFVKPSCATHSHALLQATALVSLAIVGVGATLSWAAVQRTSAANPTDDGQPREPGSWPSSG